MADGHLTPEDRALLVGGGGIDAEIADQLIENAIGTYGLPVGVGLNLIVNGRDHLVPMVVEEPSVVAAQSHAAKVVAGGGGFHSAATDPIMIAQVQVVDCEAPEQGARAVEAEAESLVRDADAVHPRLLERGGGCRGIEARVVRHPDGESFLVVHILVDVRDAMGANLLNTIAESLAERIASIAGGRPGLQILSNLADRRRVETTCRVPILHLNWRGFEGQDVANGVVAASRFAEADPYRAATHNKGILNGVDSLLVATGNDWRAIEAGAHAYAARDGCYRPLSRWWLEDDYLVGALDMPMAIGTVGGLTRTHPLARRLMEIIPVTGAQQLAEVAGAVGLAQNFAALKALGTEGIQRGHMQLHSRRSRVREAA